MKEDAWTAIMICALVGTSMLIGFFLGNAKGYDKALADMKAITPAPKTTDQQCVAWLFETNLKDAKKKICK